MNWFALWFFWLSKILSFMQVTPRQDASSQPPPAPKPRETARTPQVAASPQPAAPKPQQSPAQKPPEAAPAQPERAPLRPEAAPAPRVIAPKPQVAAPPPPETPPTQRGTTPPLQESAPKQPETVPALHEAAPTQPAAALPQTEPEKIASALQEIASALQEIASAPRETAPAPRETAPAPQETAPAPQETAPAPQETAPAPQETAPQRQTSAKEGTGEGSMIWRKRPMIYEIPTWVWLDELRAKHGAGLTLGTIPAAEWDALAALAIDAVWLMGVWERSPAGIAVSNANAEQQDEFHRLLPDYTPADNVGSAYCVRDYVVAEHLGGPEALAQARAALNERGLRLILDFVPNHVAIDHPWASHHPEYFVRGTFEDLSRAPNAFVDANGYILANGRDPYFPPWRDVLQLNAFHTQLRAAAIETVSSIAAQCDGMRCDMAMLLLNEIFEHTWGHLAGERPPTEYWEEVIPAVKARHPGTLFIAEVYWNLEYEMMQKGFDYCYDKRLYDRLVIDNAESIRAHLTADLDYQDRLVRFIENHDEPRAAATFYGAKERAAAIVMATTPGAKLVYDGQIEGRQVKLPVFLARRRPEAPDNELSLFYRALLSAVHADLFHEGEWHLCERSGWPDNGSFHDIVAWTWRHHDHRTLIVVNLSGHRSQAMVHLPPWEDLRGNTWRLVETLAWECYVRDGGDLANSGLFVDLDAWGYHFLKFE